MTDTTSAQRTRGSATGFSTKGSRRGIGATLALAVLVFAGCAATDVPRVDGSSEAAFFQSLNVIKETLSESEQRDLAEALLVIQLTDAETVKDDFADPELKVFTASTLWERLDGKTFEEVLEYAMQSLVDFESEDDAD